MPELPSCTTLRPATEDDLPKDQCKTPELRLWTFQANAQAQRFYEKHGFQIERKTDGRDNEEKQPDVLYVWARLA